MPRLVSDAATAAPSIPVPAAAPTGGTAKATAARARILVVDDGPINRDLTTAILGPSGYRSTFAANVVGALRWAAQAPFDLILSDLHMPGADGSSFLASTRADARLRAIPFMLISYSARGYSDRKRALDLGAARFLLRPVDPQKFVEEVEDILKARREPH